MSRLGLSWLCCVVFRWCSWVPFIEGSLVGKLSFLGLFNQRGQIPFIMAWLYMLLDFGFQENNSMPPSRHRAIILVEAKPIRLTPLLQTKLPKSYKWRSEPSTELGCNGYSFSLDWLVVSWCEDKIRLSILPWISTTSGGQWWLEFLSWLLFRWPIHGFKASLV